LDRLPTFYQNLDGNGKNQICLFNKQDQNAVTGPPQTVRIVFGAQGQNFSLNGYKFYTEGDCKNGEVKNRGSVQIVSAPIPTLTEWGLIALAVLLAGSLAFMIRRRFTPRPAGA